MRALTSIRRIRAARKIELERQRAWDRVLGYDAESSKADMTELDANRFLRQLFRAVNSGLGPRRIKGAEEDEVGARLAGRIFRSGDSLWLEIIQTVYSAADVRRKVSEVRSLYPAGSAAEALELARAEIRRNYLPPRPLDDKSDGSPKTPAGRVKIRDDFEED